MITTATRIRVQEIICRIEKLQKVEISERIYLSKIASVSSLVKGWLKEALGDEAYNIDHDESII
tara:strand:- start:7478 stop:7669 length:192 start_codon:yes stop_codon:yes gene_type:complete